MKERLSDAHLAWDKGGGLLPAVVQDAETLQVLMLGYMSPDSLARTRATGRVTFYSRSKARLWEKGETSGNTLEVVDIAADCDGDALLVRARPLGPTCHRGTTSCFGEETAPGIGFLVHLAGVIAERARELPEGSYTTKLLKAGVPRAAQKVGEEAVEVVIAALANDGAREEIADLLYHLLVLMQARQIPLADVTAVLRARHR